MLRSLYQVVWPVLILVFAAPAAEPNVETIIQKSVAANQRDFAAAPQFNNKERDRVGGTMKTFQVTMLEGSPYNRLIALNENPLSPEQADAEQKKETETTAKRRAESAKKRAARIAEFEKERKRDHLLLSQLSVAFDFAPTGTRVQDGHNVWVLKATPKAGYRPPNMECHVLTGMEGEMWIDQQTYEWVKVTAHVIRPVSIEGFLARVEPGTEFEIEKVPVGGGIWQISHFSMHSSAKVLLVVNKNSAEEDWFYDYQRIGQPTKPK